MTAEEYMEEDNRNWDADLANTPGVHWSTEGYVVIVLTKRKATRLRKVLATLPNSRTEEATKELIDKLGDMFDPAKAKRLKEFVRRHNEDMKRRIQYLK